MITAGIDCGAKNTKAVLMKDGEIIGKGIVLTGFDQEKAFRASLEAACADAGIKESDIERFGSTGSGKNAVKGSIAVNDIRAIGKAAIYFFSKAATVADVGAEEGRAARIDEKGNAKDFAINDRCAAGAGAFIEAMARALETPVEDMGRLANNSENEISINAQCVIFAESEVVSLIHAKTPKNDISKAIHDAVAGRIVSMIRRIGINEEVVILGGVANNPGFVMAMKARLNVDNIKIPDNPEFGAAVGVALIAAE